MNLCKIYSPFVKKPTLCSHFIHNEVIYSKNLNVTFLRSISFTSNILRSQDNDINKRKREMHPIERTLFHLKYDLVDFYRLLNQRWKNVKTRRWPNLKAKIKSLMDK